MTSFLVYVCLKIFCGPLFLLYQTLLTCPAPASSPVTALSTAINFYLTDFNDTSLCTISDKLDLL